MEGVDLYSIPCEVLELILESEVLSFYDVCQFGSTCSHFQQLVNTSYKIWKAKFKQRWPQLMEHESFQSHVIKGWLATYKQRHLIGCQTMRLVGNMAVRFMTRQELSACDFEEFDKVYSTSEQKLALFFMIDELMLWVHHKDSRANLTNKYYCEKVLHHLRQVYLTEKWEIFKNLPPEEQILESIAVIVSQWCQPTEEITDKSIANQLNSIADEVRKRLHQEYGEKHPALCVPRELQAEWQIRNLADNHYSPYVSHQVIQAVSTLLFKEMGFFCNGDMYYSFENSFINKVLELRKGVPITLFILFESVTRRLGLKCEPVSTPGHFLLRWRDTYKKDASSMYYYIDIFNGGTFLGKESCPRFPTSRGQCPMGDVFRFGPASAIQVMERMANNLEMAGRQRDVMHGRTARFRSILELLQLVNPTSLEGLMQFVRLYMEFWLDLRPLYRSLQTNVNTFNVRDMGQVQFIMRSLEGYCHNFPRSLGENKEESAVKRRHKDTPVAYAVGMVMHHRQYNYMCVVIGWDPQCAASDEWMAQMNINSLSRKNCQPFYQVLVWDGTNRYAAEENLDLENIGHDRWITHSDIGRYFDTFYGSYYLPNAELQRLYPDDLPVLRRCLNLS